jgi:hypothetical protein
MGRGDFAFITAPATTHDFESCVGANTLAILKMNGTSVQSACMGVNGCSRLVDTANGEVVFRHACKLGLEGTATGPAAIC